MDPELVFCGISLPTSTTAAQAPTTLTLWMGPFSVLLAIVFHALKEASPTHLQPHSPKWQCWAGAQWVSLSSLQCDAGTESWQRVNTELPVKSPRFALFDLAEGKSYQFRVRCSNSAGVGEPSEATEVTVVGDKLGECRWTERLRTYFMSKSCISECVCTQRLKGSCFY